MEDCNSNTPTGESGQIGSRPNHGGRFLNKAAYAAQEALETAREDNDRYVQGIKDAEQAGK
jgi:hypothetical protein